MFGDTPVQVKYGTRDRLYKPLKWNRYQHDAIVTYFARNNPPLQKFKWLIIGIGREQGLFTQYESVYDQCVFLDTFDPDPMHLTEIQWDLCKDLTHINVSFDKYKLAHHFDVIIVMDWKYDAQCVMNLKWLTHTNSKIYLQTNTTTSKSIQDIFTPCFNVLQSECSKNMHATLLVRKQRESPFPTWQFVASWFVI
jgi:hypothetical protein